MGKTEIAFFFSDFQCYWILELALMLPTPHNMLAFGAKKIDRKIRQPQTGELWKLAIKLKVKPCKFVTSLFIMSHWLHL